MPEQKSFSVTVYITTDTLAHAEQVVAERIGFEETYIDDSNQRFDYALSNSPVTEDTTVDLDKAQNEARAIAHDVFTEKFGPATPENSWPGYAVDAATMAAFIGLTGR